VSAELRYYPTFVETSDTTAEWHDWLTKVESGAEASELATITDICATAKCKATLHDAAGFVCGFVDANGDYRLES
jgi:hypothetical protein